MPLTRPWAVDQAYPTPADARKQLSGVYPREGVFPDPISASAAGIAYGNSVWNVAARQFVAALKRGGAPYTQAYGTALISNDSAATAWVIPGAPTSGSRIDRLWVRATDPTQGEALDGSTPPRAVPVFGITSGVTLPALPAGALEIAQVSTPSSATSIANSTITQVYPFAQVAGGILYARNFTQLDALADAGIVKGQRAVTFDNGNSYAFDGAAWIIETPGAIPRIVVLGSGVQGISGGPTVVTALAQSGTPVGFTWNGTTGRVTLNADAPAGAYFLSAALAGSFGGQLFVYKNGVALPGVQNGQNAAIGMVVDLVPGDYIDLRGFDTGNTAPSRTQLRLDWLHA